MAAKKRTASPAQLRALARGRAKLKLARKRGETPKRKTNPLKSGYSTRTVSDNVAKMVREGKTPGVATAAALRSARTSYRKTHPRGAFPSHIAITRTTRRRNPDPALMRTRTLMSPTKAGKKRLSNPSYYVVYDGKRYFDGAGWTVSKSHAAHYTMKKLAALIGQKVADVTGKDVYVVPA